MSEQSNTLTIRQAMNVAVDHHNAGRLSEAETVYQQILQGNPNHPDALHMLGVLSHQAGKNDIAVDLITRALVIKPNFAEAHSNLGIALHGLGKLKNSVTSYQEALRLDPDFAGAHNNLANALRALGRLKEAIASYDKATELEPDRAETYNNKGVVLRELGRLDEAAASYQKALRLKPDYAAACFNLGNTLQNLGKLEEAIASYDKATELEPDYAVAHSNKGTALREFGRLDDAIKCYQTAIRLEPGSAGVHNNLGNVFRTQGKLEAAIDSYRRALAIKQDFFESHINIGNAFQELSRLNEAVSSFQAALSIEPTLFQGHYDLANTLRQLGKLDDATTSYRKALSTKSGHLNSNTNLEEREPAAAHTTTTHPASLEEVTALMTVGRSGSLLFHSLFDGHPDIATLPSVYFQGYFGTEVWQHLHPNHEDPRWREITTAAVLKHFDILFDAQSRQPLFGNILFRPVAVGVATGCTTMGEARDQVLTLDRATFSEHLLSFLRQYRELNPKLLFQLIHLAFEKTLDRGITPKQLFYHIHNPTTSELANFVVAFPRTRFLLTVREPVQNVESWAAMCLLPDPSSSPPDAGTSQHKMIESDYLTLAKLIPSIHNQMANNVFLCFPSKAVRLEDIKLQPEILMPKVAEWIGISDHQSLYQSTFQGLTYWGPYSALNPEIRGFDPTSVKRKAGIIFSEKDIRIFKTLFYYFRVHYGYQDENEKDFDTSLKEIRNYLDEPFDFERDWIRTRSNNLWQPQDFFPYHVLRTRIKGIWKLLHTQKSVYGMPRLLNPGK